MGSKFELIKLAESMEKVAFFKPAPRPIVLSLPFSRGASQERMLNTAISNLQNQQLYEKIGLGLKALGIGVPFGFLAHWLSNRPDEGTRRDAAAIAQTPVEGPLVKELIGR